MRDAETDVDAFLNKAGNESQQAVVRETKLFLSGFYSPFALELLSSVDYLMSMHKLNTADEVATCLEAWSDRKKTLFSNPRFISLAVQKISQISA